MPRDRSASLRFAILTTALVLAACAPRAQPTGPGQGGSATTTPPSPPASPPPSPTRPHVVVPQGPPPATLVARDLVVGTGAEAKAGLTVTVQYVGVSYSTGKEFDASWDRGQPFTFGLGIGRVIAGWDQGLVGMRVGGRRELIIPPDLAYGPKGFPPKIGPNETLIFVIDLVSVV